VRGPNDEETVVEGQLDEVDDELPVVKNQGAVRFGFERVRAAFCHG
jgi:hypothetical protein